MSERRLKMRGLSIYLKRPARKWDDGLPLGNGRLGAMVMGKLKEETIIINEETLCYGPSRDRENPDAYGELQNIRELLLEGRVEKAAFLAKMALTSTPKYNNPYQPAGDLRLCFLGETGKAENYERRLDISRAAAKVTYEMNGTRYEREHLVSRKYNVLAVRIRAVGTGSITVSANISRKPFEEYTGKLGERTAGNWGENGVGGMHYLSAVRIASPDARNLGDAVYIEEKKETVIYLTSLTDYDDCLKGNRKEAEEAYGNLGREAQEILDRAETAGFEQILQEHLRDYGELYNNFELCLGSECVNECLSEETAMTTDEMLKGFREGNRENELQLAMLLVQFARYLMISSSDGCRLPANLQGLWSGAYEPPWQCQYTININTQMNYWFVEKAGLSRCHLPLFGLIRLLAQNGRKTADKLYHSRGFCAHHNTNVWGCTAPEGIFDASPYWVMGGAWLCIHLYEHYEYTKDKKFLEESMPLMREAIRFFEDYLYELPNGYLVTGPVVSPENTYRSRKGETGALAMGTAMDNCILRQLLTSYIKGMHELSICDEEESALLEGMLNKLPPLMIGSDGRLLEWMEEYEETEPGHRHISHLYGLHPGNEITPEKKELFDAARKTLEYRLANGGGHTGWSRAWLACFAARLQDGEALRENIAQLLSKCIQDNMLDVHPPFQIDGNFGIAEAVLEGLVQERNGRTYLLPAIPKRWECGMVKGFCLRGGRRIDMSWENGRPVSVTLYASEDADSAFCWKDREMKIFCPAGKSVEFKF